MVGFRKQKSRAKLADGSPDLNAPLLSEDLRLPLEAIPAFKEVKFTEEVTSDTAAYKYYTIHSENPLDIALLLPLLLTNPNTQAISTTDLHYNPTAINVVVAHLTLQTVSTLRKLLGVDHVLKIKSGTYRLIPRYSIEDCIARIKEFNTYHQSSSGNPNQLPPFLALYCSATDFHHHFVPPKKETLRNAGSGCWDTPGVFTGIASGFPSHWPGQGISDTFIDLFPHLSQHTPTICQSNVGGRKGVKVSFGTAEELALFCASDQCYTKGNHLIQTHKYNEQDWTQAGKVTITPVSPRLPPRTIDTTNLPILHFPPDLALEAMVTKFRASTTNGTPVGGSDDPHRSGSSNTNTHSNADSPLAGNLSASQTPPTQQPETGSLAPVTSGSGTGVQTHTAPDTQNRRDAPPSHIPTHTTTPLTPATAGKPRGKRALSVSAPQQQDPKRALGNTTPAHTTHYTGLHHPPQEQKGTRMEGIHEHPSQQNNPITNNNGISQQPHHNGQLQPHQYTQAPPPMPYAPGFTHAPPPRPPIPYPYPQDAYGRPLPYSPPPHHNPHFQGHMGYGYPMHPTPNHPMHQTPYYNDTFHNLYPQTNPHPSGPPQPHTLGSQPSQSQSQHTPQLAQHSHNSQQSTHQYNFLYTGLGTSQGDATSQLSSVDSLSPNPTMSPKPSSITESEPVMEPRICETDDAKDHSELDSTPTILANEIPLPEDSND